MAYGFVADPNKTASHNAFLHLRTLSWLEYSLRPTNLAFHDLTRHHPPPLNLRSVLGLGLKFIPTPTFPTRWLDIGKRPQCTLSKLYRSFQLREYFSDCPPANPAIPSANYDPKLHIASDWSPPRPLGTALHSRLVAFQEALRPLYRRRRSRFNLLRTQRHALEQALAARHLVVISCDKNLGPAIIERDRYIQMALSEHLSDTATYRKLSSQRAHNHMDQVRDRLEKWLKKHNSVFSRAERKFLRRHLDECSDPFPYFYLLAKVHKSPLCTRPIVSCSGSLLYALGVWIDTKLQKVAALQHTYIKSSFELKTELLSLHLPPGALFFTSDARSMYTNILTTPALTEISAYLRRNHRKFSNVPVEALIPALELVMRNNVIQFGDTFWRQRTGCAMGTPPAPPYATLYYAIWEETLLAEFGAHLIILRRYIDDMIGIWVPLQDPPAFDRFKNRLNDYHQLEWDTSALSSTVDFLDLTLTISGSRVSTTLFSKPLNLYLYIPPRSAHPPGVLTGLVFGMIFRIFSLCSEPDDRRRRLQDFWNRLLARGYSTPILLPLFKKGISLQLSRATNPRPPAEPTFFFHTRYHPQDPPSTAIQRAWKQHVADPPDDVPLSDLVVISQHGTRHHFLLNRLTICYHRPPNLGNLFSVRKLTAQNGPLVSSYLD